MENTEAIWQQRLAKRRAGTPWKSIIEAEGFKYGGTFTYQLKKARERGWIPPEESLPLARRSDGKRVGLTKPKPVRPEEPMTDETPVEMLPGPMDQDADTPHSSGGVSAVADMVPMGEGNNALSPAEVQTLEHYEQIITQGFKTFVEVGQALMAIRDQHLYRQSYQTFEDYLRQRWDLSRPYAYQLMDASMVVENVSAVADIAPVNEAQARPLTTLPAEQQREIWQEAVETAPPSGITAKHVQETVKRVKAPGTTPPKTTTPKPFAKRGPAFAKLMELGMTMLGECDTMDKLDQFAHIGQELQDAVIRCRATMPNHPPVEAPPPAWSQQVHDLLALIALLPAENISVIISQLLQTIGHYAESIREDTQRWALQERIDVIRTLR
jgi:hypothetical protein